MCTLLPLESKLPILFQCLSFESVQIFVACYGQCHSGIPNCTPKPLCCSRNQRENGWGSYSKACPLF